MELTENQFLVFFITRTSMFAKDERDFIIPFITGYDIGKNTNLISIISKLLEEKYQCPRRAAGWNYQIEIHADNKGLSWESTFKKIILEIVFQRAKKEEYSKIEEFIKSIIISKIARIRYVEPIEARVKISHFGENWITKWLGIVDTEKEWFRNYWSKQQLSIIEKINSAITRDYKGSKERGIKPTLELVELSKEFEKLKPDAQQRA